MSPHNQQVEPTPFEPAAVAPQASSTQRDGSRPGPPRWVIPALLILAAVALLVVFWLPGSVQPPAPLDPQLSPTPAPDTAAGADTSGRGEPAPEASPYSDAQFAKLRKQAQDVLAQLLDLQEQLEQRGAQQWAPEQLANAQAAATKGDELYRQREFEAATDSYQDGRDQLQTLLDSLPQQLQAQLQLAQQGIEAGELDQVTSALDSAALMGPESAELASLQQRAATLPALLEKLATAAEAEASGDLAAADSQLREAVALDPAHQRAAAESARVAAAYNNQQFNAAMSEGYAALDEARFDAARSSFNRARKLQPEAGEASSALQELQAAATAHRLASLKQKGEQQEQQEDWQAAVTSYEQAQEIDASVVFAQEGLARSKPRGRLDQQFKTAIKDPERLADSSVARATRALLDQAATIEPQGPVLASQIDQLEQLLSAANQPVRVTLRSDQQTQVTVYKVARLGEFEQRELELRPGTYTAVGSRSGYRDVRQNFTVSHDQQPPTIFIACTETIQGAR